MSIKPAPTPARLAAQAFHDHAGELQRYLVRRLNHVQDADDLSQEVFARLLRIKNADLVRQPLAYVLGIANHVVREFRQRKQLGPVLFDSELADSVSDNSPQADGLGHADQLELQERLNLAFEQLPPTHRLVLLLVKRDGLSYPEAAKATGLSVHTIEKYLVESRAILRVLLQDMK